MFKPKNITTTYSAIIKKEDTVPPDVYITAEALAKMKQYVDQCDKEIGWLAYVEKNDGAYYITDTILLDQKVTGVTTELEEEAMNDFANELIMANRIDDLQKIRCWGHSHVNMDVNPSGTDEDTFKEYYSTCDFFIRIIANKKGDLRLDIAETRKNVIFNNVKWIALCNDEEAILQDKIEKLEAEIKKLYEEVKNTSKNFVSKYHDSIKSEIAKKVKDEVTHVSTKSWKNKTKYTSPYNYDYDYEEEYYGWYNNVYYDEQSDARGYGLVKIHKGTQYEEFAHISQVLSFEDIEEIYYISNAKSVSDLYKKYEDFLGYDKEDWMNLVDACTSYCEEKYEELYLMEKEGKTA